MKQFKRGCKESQFIDPDFAEALNEGDSSTRSSDRQAQRKVRQFCRQVQRALNLALANCNADDGVDGLFVEVHEAPERALSDGPNALRLERLGPLLALLGRIHSTVSPTAASIG